MSNNLKVEIEITGETKRDMMAALFMAQLVSHRHYEDMGVSAIAEEAYRFADVMITVSKGEPHD